MERQASAVAARVASGESAGDLLAQYSPRAPSAMAIQRDSAPGASPLQRSSARGVDAVIAALAKPDEVAGVGDFPAAFATLDGLDTDHLLLALAELDQRGFLDLLVDNEAVAEARPRGERLVGAMRAVRAVRRGGAPVTQEQLVSDAERIGALSIPDLNAIMQMFVRTLPSIAAEGMLAMAATAPLLPGAVAASGSGPVMPGPFVPPGRQPIPYYIGTAAHAAIAETYVAAHPGQEVRFNNIAVSTILTRLAARGQPNTPANVSPSDLGLEPDITNLDKLHLYEIKPQSAQALAAAEATMYVGLFVAAGVPMTLGPSAEPGTAGIVPAPGGYYAFESPAPGVIVYQYRRGQYQPAPVPVTSSQPEGQSEFMAKMRALTGLTGTALIIYIIISEGSRAFPPRNLIPVP